VDDQLSAYQQELAADYSERLAQIRHLQERAAQVTATARSRNGLIGVEVGAHGELLAVKLDPGAYERLSPQRLAKVLVDLAKTAAADAAGQVRELMAPVLPAGGMPADGDFGKALPRTPGEQGPG